MWCIRSIVRGHAGPWNLKHQMEHGISQQQLGTPHFLASCSWARRLSDFPITVPSQPPTSLFQTAFGRGNRPQACSMSSPGGEGWLALWIFEVGKTREPVPPRLPAGSSCVQDHGLVLAVYVTLDASTMAVGQGQPGEGVTDQEEARGWGRRPCPVSQHSASNSINSVACTCRGAGLWVSACLLPFIILGILSLLGGGALSQSCLYLRVRCV